MNYHQIVYKYFVVGVFAAIAAVLTLVAYASAGAQ